MNFIVSDSGAHVLNSWTQEDQNLQELMAALAAVGPPNPRADPECCSILHGLVAAVETLCKITEYQHEARTLLMENAERVGNRGRIICITNAKSDSHVRMLEDCVQDARMAGPGSPQFPAAPGVSELCPVHVFVQKCERGAAPPARRGLRDGPARGCLGPAAAGPVRRRLPRRGCGARGGPRWGRRSAVDWRLDKRSRCPAPLAPAH